ncbi:MAG: site-2 protease family protein [Candidatus Hodarchaeales archaeon]
MDFLSFFIIIGASWMVLSIISFASLKYMRIRNPEIGFGYIMLRTSKLNSFIDALASRGKLFWQVSFDIGIIVAIAVLITAIFLFGLNIVLFLLSMLSDSGILPVTPGSIPSPIEVTPAVPGLTISLEMLPYFFIAVMVGAALHELSHGLAARAAGIELKSTGLIFFLIFFAAFVEPDEESIKKSHVRDRLRVYAAGPLANIITALFLMILLLPPLFQLQTSLFAETSPSGVMLVYVVPDSPAFEQGFRPGNVLVGIFNGTESDAYFRITSPADFHNFTLTTHPGQHVTIDFLSKQDIEFVLGTHPDENKTQGYFGVLVDNFYAPKFDFLPLNSYNFYYNVLVITSSISLMLALMNLLPVPPFDGSRLIEDYLTAKGVPKKVSKAIQLGSVAILLGNILLTLLLRGLVMF